VDPELIVPEPYELRGLASPPAAFAQQLQPAPLPVYYQPPPPPQQILVNVVQHTTANATAIAGGRPYVNGWAQAALAIAFLSFLLSFVPFIGLLAIWGVVLSLVLAAIGFLASLIHSGRGLLSSLAAAGLSGVACIVALASTGGAIVKQAAESAPPRATTQPAVALPSKVAAARVLPAAAPASTGPAESTETRVAAKPAVSEPAPASVPKVDAAAAARKRHTALLSQARTLIKAGILPGAEKRLKQIIDEAPGTAIADEAQKEIDSMPRH